MTLCYKRPHIEHDAEVLVSDVCTDRVFTIQRRQDEQAKSVHLQQLTDGATVNFATLPILPLLSYQQVTIPQWV